MKEEVKLILQDTEGELINLVKKWTIPFAWRKNFLVWQQIRIWQEFHRTNEIKTLVYVIPNLKNQRILDIGSGMGGFLSSLIIL